MYNKSGCPEKDVPAPDVEAQVLDEVTRLAQGPMREDVEAELRKIVELAAAETNNGSAVAKLEQAQKKLDRLIDAYGDGVISKDELASRRQNLDAEIADLKNKIEIQSVGSVAEIEALIVEVMDNLSRLSESRPEVQKDVIRAMFERIELKNRQVIRISPRPWTKPFYQLCEMSARLKDC
jgi:hypothetical protein